MKLVQAMLTTVFLACVISASSKPYAFAADKPALDNSADSKAAATAPPTPGQSQAPSETAAKVMTEAQEHRQKGEYDKAIALFDMAEKLWGVSAASAVSADLISQRASCYVKLNKYAEAEKDFAAEQKSLFTPLPLERIDKDELLKQAVRRCIISRYDCLVLTGRWGDAYAHLAQVQQLGVSIPIHEHRGQLLWLGGLHQRAVDEMQESVKEAPNDPARKQQLEQATAALKQPKDRPTLTSTIRDAVRARAKTEVEALNTIPK